jgi:hypothetical protein
VHDNAQQKPPGLQPSHQCKHLLEIDPLLLYIPFQHQTGFVLNQGALFIMLELVDLLQADHAVTLGEVHECPCLVVIDGIHLSSIMTVLHASLCSNLVNELGSFELMACNSRMSRTRVTCPGASASPMISSILW